jgi:protein-S-isoprenylcysteine O-methyltransferase Ste14
MKLETMLRKKLLPPTLFIICAILSIILNFIIQIYIVKYPYNLIGMILLFIGLIISRTGSNQFQKAETNINTFDEPDKLITSGLFKYSRNPMYLGFVITLLGISIILGTISAFIILIIFKNIF